MANTIQLSPAGFLGASRGTLPPIFYVLFTDFFTFESVSSTAVLNLSQAPPREAILVGYLLPSV